jgi:hypothetical protein
MTFDIIDSAKGGLDDWAKQVKGRAIEVTDMIKTGTYTG